VEGGWYSTVQIKDGFSLGGAYAGSDGWRAVTLEKCSRLVATNDVTLAEPTRGLFVNRNGYVKVNDGATLALDCPFTMGGELVKLGGGTLSLGGQIAFADGDPATAPTAETNRLVVSEGALKASATNACDGLAISFAAGTRLVLDATDEAVAEFGLYDVAWSSPISLAEGVLSVAFDLPESFDHKVEHRLGICTVSPAAAEAFTVDSFAVERVAGTSAKVVRVENRDAEENVVSVTFACDLSPKGLLIMVY
jgi:hypothetical protein